MRLRPITADDRWLFVELLCDDEVMHHLGGAISVEAAEQTLARQIDPAAADTTWARAILTEEDEVAGSLALWIHDGEDPITEIGWMVRPAFQGRGIGKRAVAMLLDEAQADGRWGPIYAFPADTNEASNAMSRTLGFTLVEVKEFVYQGRTLRCNVWRHDPP
ncbi:MAG TPA: GNAT family N-acetyltransferase [Actinomycetota bacterium]|nr:GNAT family N-acetyltransferase [Actinomycetota bacterium]